MTKYLIIAIFLVSSFMVFHFTRTGVTHEEPTIPVLEKVVGGIESLNGAVQRCSLQDVTQIPTDTLNALLREAAEEAEDVLFHHIRTQVPSIEYKAYIQDDSAERVQEITLLRDYENGYGKTGEASQTLRDLIDEACNNLHN